MKQLIPSLILVLAVGICLLDSAKTHADVLVRIRGTVSGFTEEMLHIENGAVTYYLRMDRLPKTLRESAKSMGAPIELRIPASLVRVRTDIKGKPHMDSLLGSARLYSLI